MGFVVLSPRGIRYHEADRVVLDLMIRHDLILVCMID